MQYELLQYDLHAGFLPIVALCRPQLHLFEQITGHRVVSLVFVPELLVPTSAMYI